MVNERHQQAWEPLLPIETERLRLRAHRLGDLDDLDAFHGDPEVTRYIPWPVRTRSQTLEALIVKCRQAVARQRGDWLVLAIEETDSALVIGEVLLKRGDDRSSEIGYVIRRDRQGRGLASEAVRAMLRLAFESFDRSSVAAVVEPDNAASVRLLRRLGFQPAEATDAGTLRFELRPYDRGSPPTSAAASSGLSDGGTSTSTARACTARL